MRRPNFMSFLRTRTRPCQPPRWLGGRWGVQPQLRGAVPLLDGGGVGPAVVGADGGPWGGGGPAGQQHGAEGGDFHGCQTDRLVSEGALGLAVGSKKQQAARNLMFE